MRSLKIVLLIFLIIGTVVVSVKEAKGNDKSKNTITTKITQNNGQQTKKPNNAAVATTNRTAAITTTILTSTATTKTTTASTTTTTKPNTRTANTTTKLTTKTTTASTTTTTTIPPTTTQGFTRALTTCEDEKNPLPCPRTCEALKLAYAKKKENSYVNVVLGIFLGFFIVVGILLLIYKFFVKGTAHKQPSAETPNSGSNEKMGSKENEGQKTPSKGVQSPMKRKFNVMDPAIRMKHRRFVTAKIKEDKEDAKSKNFKKGVPIHIPMEVPDEGFAQKCEAPNNVALEKVFYDEKQNEAIDIGSGIDDIEFAPSTIAGISTTTDERSLLKTKTKTSLITNSRISKSKQ